MLSVDAIAAAQQRIQAHIHTTPIVSSSRLDDWLGHRIVFKAECLQKIGAFKARGACNAIAAALEDPANGNLNRVVANSSGNHAQAIAWAAAKFGLACTIYMPKNVSSIKATATAGYGAEVVLLENRAQVDEQVAIAGKEEGVLWIPPYDHEDVIAGQGTAVYEALSSQVELGEVDAVFVPCGGGGLASGSLIAARGLAPRTKVIGAEPLNANDAARSLRAGKILGLEGPANTIADGVRTPSVGKLTFEYLQQLDDFYEVTEEAIIYWTQWLNHLLKLRIEPTSAMTMDAVCQWLVKQTSPQTVLLVLSGGNIDAETERLIWAQDALTKLPTLS